LKGMDNSKNWVRQTSAGQAFIEGFQSGLFIGLLSGGLSTGIGAEVNLYRSKITQAKNYVKNIPKSQPNFLNLKNGRRIDFRPQHPKGAGHFNKTTQTRYKYPHVADPKAPGGVRNINNSDWIE